MDCRAWSRLAIDDLDEVAQLLLLIEDLNVPTSRAGATRDMPMTQSRRQISSWVQIEIILAAPLVAGCSLTSREQLIVAGG